MNFVSIPELEITLIQDVNKPFKCIQGSFALIKAQIASDKTVFNRNITFSVPLLSGEEIIEDVVNRNKTIFNKIGVKKYYIELYARAYRTGNYCVELNIGASRIRSQEFVIITVREFDEFLAV